MLGAYDFDLISFDFNLAGGEDGDVVARGIASSRNARTPVLVHSMNPRGAVRLAGLLPHASCVPVSSLVKSNATAKRVREVLRQGVPADWHGLLAGGTSGTEKSEGDGNPPSGGVEGELS